MNRRTVISSIVSTLLAVSILTFSVSTEIASAHGDHSEPCNGPHKNNLGCDDGGGDDGSGNSSLRLNAIFNDPDASTNYIDEDGKGSYSDGEDGEILIAEGLKFSTVTRNKNDRRVAVTFQGNHCPTDSRRAGFDTFSLSGQLMNAFFANAQSTEFDGCDPGDPFDAAFDPNLLTCLSSNLTQLPVGEMLLDETRFMSMRLNLTEPGVSLKKSEKALVLTFAEDLGANPCGIDDALPVAIKCIDDDESGACSAWHFKAFRACVFDYDATRGGSWRRAASACPVSADISFDIMP